METVEVIEREVNSRQEVLKGSKTGGEERKHSTQNNTSGSGDKAMTLTTLSV